MVNIYRIIIQYKCYFHCIENGDSDSKPANYSFFSIEYYQQFFNVDTHLVMERIISSMVPRRAPSTYLKQNIGRNPDLYGPFWIVVTLVNIDCLQMFSCRNAFFCFLQVFFIAISGNVANYLQHTDKFQWRYNFHLVSIAATTIVMYVCFVPLGLWAAFKWFVQPSDPDLDIEVFASLFTILFLFIALFFYPRHRMRQVCSPSFASTVTRWPSTFPPPYSGSFSLHSCNGCS